MNKPTATELKPEPMTTMPRATYWELKSELERVKGQLADAKSENDELFETIKRLEKTLAKERNAYLNLQAAEIIVEEQRDGLLAALKKLYDARHRAGFRDDIDAEAQAALASVGKEGK